jgi:hypothetical protein
VTIRPVRKLAANELSKHAMEVPRPVSAQ